MNVMSGFVFFVGMFLAGDYLSGRFALPIPGSIIGLAFAFFFLLVRGKVDSPLKAAGDIFIRYLPLMLVPIGVAGFVQLVDSPPAALWRLITVLLIALVVGVVGAAKAMQAILRLAGSSALASAAAAKPAPGQRGKA